MRSKNHVLYELYLEEENASELFDKTEKFSLGHIVTFVNIYNELRDGQNAAEILKLASGVEIGDIEDMTDQDFNLYSAIKKLYRTLDAAEVDILDDVIIKIDQYHENKRNA